VQSSRQAVHEPVVSLLVKSIIVFGGRDIALDELKSDLLFCCGSTSAVVKSPLLL
jgi:hypothetical protein